MTISISPEEIGSFRDGVRQHRHDGCTSGRMSDCCLRAGMLAAAEHRERAARRAEPELEQCGFTEALASPGGRVTFRCRSVEGHPGDHLLALEHRRR